MTLLLAVLATAPTLQAVEATEAAPPAPVVSVPAPRPQPATDPTRYRCKVAGAVLLGAAGAAIVSMLSVVIYRAVNTPDQVTLEAGPRLGFGLSSVALTVAGSALLGYGLSAPSSPPPPAAAPPPSSPAVALGLTF